MKIPRNEKIKRSNLSEKGLFTIRSYTDFIVAFITYNSKDIPLHCI